MERLEKECKFYDDGYCRLRYIKEQHMQGELRQDGNICDLDEAPFCKQYEIEMPSCLAIGALYD